ncbi:MAG: permease-like cell division protein FtsX, partial [Bacteroidota bacterium]
MQLGYLLKEGFSGFKRAKLSMVAAIVTISISLLFLSFFSILLFNANVIVESLRDKVEMEAFLAETLTPDAIDGVRASVGGLRGVREVRYVSKEEAAAIFKEEFGEDIYRVLDFNPLPASLKIFLAEEYRNVQGADSVYSWVKEIPGVEDVIYRKSLLEMLDRRARLFLWVSFGIGVFITVSSIFLVANTIRLAIYNKRKIIQTMKLIGATRRFIRFPFLLEGLIQGMVGGLFAAATVYGVFEILSQWISVQLSDFVRVEPVAYAIILGAGCVLGLLGSM